MMIKTKTPTPRQWVVLHRLQAAGCPVDLAKIQPPIAPLRMVQLAQEMVSNVLPIIDGCGIAFRVRLIASESITITGCRLKADWLEHPLEWVAQCGQHRGRHCLLVSEEQHVQFSSVLNDQIGRGVQLRAGQYLEGFLVGQTAKTVKVSASTEELLVTLWVRDLRHDEYPYIIRLRNCPTAIAASLQGPGTNCEEPRIHPEKDGERPG